jgi:hypothetical protein
MNTDLDIISNKDLSDLANILEKKCYVLHSEKKKDGFWHICVEAKGSGMIGTKNHKPNKDIESLLKIIEGLDDKRKKILKKSDKFDFNIGWQSSDKRPEGSFSFESKLLHRITNCGATVTVTIYPSNENDF